MPAARPPVALIVCDGWGLSDLREANAIRAARTPFFDRMAAEGPLGRLLTSGLAVGLPEGQMGNSEVGHTNMGAGRIVYQELTRIDKAIREGDFFTNPVLVEACRQALALGRPLQLLGLVSDGGVHSSLEHLVALVELAHRQGLSRTWVHAILDGRDVPPQSAEGYLQALEARIAPFGGAIATVSGRFYAMDRDTNWDRIQPAYAAMVHAQGPSAEGALEGLARSYAEGVKDEFVLPFVVRPEGRIQSGDVIVFGNFRPDRARQLTRALAVADFDGFERPGVVAGHFVCLTQYDRSFGLPLAYPPQGLQDDLASVVARERLRQLHSAETEKYAHVTFFFNCGREAPHEGEQRILVPSPKVATYDLQPEMAAPEVARQAAEAIDRGETDLLILNFANADMVGHTGNFAATVQAIEAVDAAVARVLLAIERQGGVALVTADHGNAEQMLDPTTSQPHTAHTTNPVPLHLFGGRGRRLAEEGVLADVAPTLLELLGLERPEAMTARSLLGS